MVFGLLGWLKCKEFLMSGVLIQVPQVVEIIVRGRFKMVTNVYNGWFIGTDRPLAFQFLPCSPYVRLLLLCKWDRNISFPFLSFT